jgi:DNA mismatch repair protein MutS
MMEQYFQAKEAHPGVLIAMRVGDFYEFYGEDAEKAAAVLNITLTGREDAASGGKIPMAGVPYHSVEKYLAQLIQNGLRVAICDQLEDPKKAKGLVKRGVTRVLTPGTILEDSMLEASKSNFLVAICLHDQKAGIAVLEPSTGEFTVTEISGEGLSEKLIAELARLQPSELLVDKQLEDVGTIAQAHLKTSLEYLMPPPASAADNQLRKQFGVSNLQGFGLQSGSSAVVAAGMVLGYAEKNLLPLHHLETISTYSLDEVLRMDLSTRRALELTQNLSDGSRKHTLLEVLDCTVTPMGARLLRKWIEMPLLNKNVIESRLDAVELISKSSLTRADLRDGLKNVQDLERLVSRCSTGVATPRDLVGLKLTLQALPLLSEPLRKLGVGRIQELRNEIEDHSELAELLHRALRPNPPVHLREGGVIASGYDPELDALQELSKNGKSYIAQLEATEREATGIANLKVGFNSVYGYFLEVSKSNLDKVPQHYIRKQTTAGSERYITAELKEHESRVLGAEEKSIALENEIFVNLRTRAASHASSLLKTARALAELDVLATFAEVAVRKDYCRPQFTETNCLHIEKGRHPVVEAAGNRFVPNSLNLEHERLMVLTGPNMSGKSTFLRQSALIVLMAQIGSFVPAKSCVLSPCDRIFARIGAKDELALGQSTFMVEMVESANILNHATEQSLVILDEVGRGTSTYDGLAIAWAMVEHLSEVNSKTLFATHYHQLNALADSLPNVANYRVSVEERGDDIIWTHLVLPGGTDRSYGIHVAKMAGVPPSVLRRASEVLADLEQKPLETQVRTASLQLTLFEAEENPLEKELNEIDVNRLSPIEALLLIERWKKGRTGP